MSELKKRIVKEKITRLERLIEHRDYEQELSKKELANLKKELKALEK